MNVVLHSRQTTWGGGETLLADLASHLRRQGQNVSINAPAGSQLLRRLDAGPDWRRVQDAVHIFNDFGSVWRTALKVRQPRRRVFVCHGWWQTSRLRNATCLALNVKTVAVSSAVRDAILRNGYVRKPVPIVPFGPAARYRLPSSEEKHSARRDLGLSSKSCVLAWVGRYQDVKRPENFIELIRSLDVPNVAGVMVVPAAAESAEEAKVRDQVLRGTAGDGRFRVVPGGDPLTAYFAADLLISTSAFESLGIAMMEGMACGLPCVSTARGGPRDFVEPVGKLVYDASPAELASVVKETLKDAGPARSAAARRSVADRNWEAVWKTFMGEKA